MTDILDDINKNIEQIVEEYDLDNEQHITYGDSPIMDSHVGKHRCYHRSYGNQCNQRVYYDDDTYCLYHKKINLGLTTCMERDEEKVWKNRLGDRYGNPLK